jgi:ElaB/YqjD/DUF883 family membrane-anchored ribosome-binding protein
MQNESINPRTGANGQGATAATPAAEDSLSGVTLEFHNFLADMEDLIKATTSLTGEDLARARAKLGERVAAARQSVEAMGGAIAHRARNTATVTDAYVHEQPWKAVGIGALVGLLLGFVLARRA